MKKFFLLFIGFFFSCRFEPFTENEFIREMPIKNIRNITGYFRDIKDSLLLFTRSYYGDSFFVYDIEKNSICERYYFQNAGPIFLMQNSIIVKKGNKVYLYKRKMGNFLDSLRFRSMIDIFRITSFEFIVTMDNKVVLYTVENSRFEPLDSILQNGFKIIKLNKNILLLGIGETSFIYKINNRRIGNFIVKNKDIKYILTNYYSEFCSQGEIYNVEIRDYISDNLYSLVSFVLLDVYEPTLYLRIKTFADEIYIVYLSSDQRTRVVILKAENDVLFVPSPTLSIEIGEGLYDIWINEDYFIATSGSTIKLYRKNL